ncbi:MAG TPA: hypothetical protein VH796_12800 [Nitrososphaeraceae archaeon]
MTIKGSLIQKYSTADQDFTKNRPLEKVFGNCNARVLDFFVINRGMDYTPAEISDITHLPVKSIQRSLLHLIKCGLVKETNKVGNSSMYVLESSELAVVLTQYVDTSLSAEVKNATISYPIES